MYYIICTHHIIITTLSLTSWGQQAVIAFNLIVLKYLDNFDCLLLAKLLQATLQHCLPLPLLQHHIFKELSTVGALIIRAF